MPALLTKEPEKLNDIETESECDTWLSSHQMKGVSKDTNQTIASVLSLREAGMLVVPAFQREKVWKKAQEQAFLDSLLNSLLTPRVTFARDPGNKDMGTCILDGLQRVSTLEKFITLGTVSLGPNGAFPNAKFADLPKEARERFLYHTLSVNEIETDLAHWSQLFRLINRGGMVLTAMEIRRAIFNSPTMQMLEKIANSTLWTGLYGKDKRKRSLEALVRAVAMHHSYRTYNKPMEQFLNSWCASHADVDVDILESRLYQVLRALNRRGKTVLHLRRTAKATKNASLTDCLIHGGLSHLVINPNASVENLATTLTMLREKLLKNEAVYQALTVTTSDKAAVQARMSFVDEFINNEKSKR